MDMNTKTTGTKTGAPQAFREMTEKGTTEAKETYEKMSVASTEAADLIQNSYLTAVKGVQDYNNKFFEFAHENTNAAFDFIQKMSGVRSPSAFVELSTEHARKQLEVADRTGKGTCHASPEGNACHRGAAQDGLEAVSPLKLAEDEPCGSANFFLLRRAGVETWGRHRRPTGFAPASFQLPACRLCNHRHGQKWGAQHFQPDRGSSVVVPPPER